MQKSSSTSKLAALLFYECSESKTDEVELAGWLRVAVQNAVRCTWLERIHWQWCGHKQLASRDLSKRHTHSPAPETVDGPIPIGLAGWFG